GGHRRARRARSASSSLIDSCASRPLGRPNDALGLSASPAAARRAGSRLSSSASTRLGSNFGAGGAGFLGGVGVLSAWGFSGFFGSALTGDFSSASAIGSGLASVGF